MTTRLSSDAVLACVRSLPALPKAVQALEQALREEGLPTERIVGIVSTDQALTSMALKLANSSFYGVSGRVLSLRDAVHILGLQTLSAAVTTAAVMARFDRTACPGFDFDGCWRHALATGLCAQLLAAPRGVDECTAYTAGLLHDIGTLALATYFPVPFGATLAFSAARGLQPLVAERELLGIDHAEVGRLIAGHWRFAPAVVEAIGQHHEVPHANGGALLDVLHLADAIAHALDLSHAADDMVPSLSLGAWERVAPSGNELQGVFARVEARVLAADTGLPR